MFLYFKEQNKKLLTGFTIIELIVSIFILSIAIIGVFSSFSIIVILTYDAADRLTASYLAQEGMEIIRNMRDTNWLKMETDESITWLDGISDCMYYNNGCKVDYTTYTETPGAYSINQWTNSDADYLDIKNGFYMYDTTSQDPLKTKFKRRIRVEQLEGYVIKVKVEVSWDQRATIINTAVLADNCTSKNCVVLEGNLYDWYTYTDELCEPDCTDKPCGDSDGCGGICLTGVCPPDQTCSGGQCILNEE